MNFDFAEPANLKELYELFRVSQGEVCILAGGTDIMVRMKKGSITPSLIINVKKIRELSSAVRLTNKGLTIGALATLTEIAKHPGVMRHYQALAEAAASVGSTQIRNRATLVGNICNASPAADGATALLLFNTMVNVIKDGNKRRTIPLSVFFQGPGQNVLERGEVVESVFLPLPPIGSGSSYYKLTRRMGADLAIVGAAAMVTTDRQVRLAYGAAGPTPFRAYSAEEVLAHASLNKAKVDEAVTAVLKTAKPIDDIRASCEYRLAMLDLFTRRALMTAAERVIEKEVLT